MVQVVTSKPCACWSCVLILAYPAQISGDTVWTAVDSFSGATMLGQAVVGSLDYSNMEHGGMYSTVSFKVLLVNINTCTINRWFISDLCAYRVMAYRARCFSGMVATSFLLNTVGSETNAVFAMPWHWHLVLVVLHLVCSSWQQTQYLHHSQTKVSSLTVR